MVMEKDREGFGKMAQAFGADVSMGGVDASKNAMQTVLKKQTEQVMLQSTDLLVNKLFACRKMKCWQLSKTHFSQVSH